MRVAGNLILSKRAQKDIERIFDRGLMEFGVERALSYRDGLLSTLTELSRNPAMGIAREDIRSGLRSHLYGVDIILYRITTQNDVRIVRVVGQKMDYRKVIR